MTEPKFISDHAARITLAAVHGANVRLRPVDRGVYSVAFEVRGSELVWLVTADPLKRWIAEAYGILHEYHETGVARPSPVVHGKERDLFNLPLSVLGLERLVPVKRGITPDYGPLLAEVRSSSPLFGLPISRGYDNWGFRAEEELERGWLALRNHDAPVLSDLANRLVDNGLAAQAVPTFSTSQMLHRRTGEVVPLGCANSLLVFGLLGNRHPYPTLREPADYAYGEGPEVTDEELSCYASWNGGTEHEHDHDS